MKKQSTFEKRRFYFSKMFVLYFAALLLLSSCLKEDKILEPHKAGDTNTVTIALGFPYLNQVFYDCETNQILSSNTRFDWDLAFESEGNHIKLNIAMSMFASNEGKVNFEDVNSTSNAVWLWDNANGDLEDLALNDWYKEENEQILYSNNVYIIDRSYDNDGIHLGYFKVQFTHVDEASFTFRFAKLNGTQDKTYTILKNASTNFTFFSFDNGGKTLSIEPDKEIWDLQFTNLQHKFSNLPLPFVLTQCITNRYQNVIAAEANDGKFDQVTLADTIKYTFTTHQDEIGFDWKIRNNIDNSFEIEPNMYFIVKTKPGYFYKIRFIDYYNEFGEKGNPKFEIQKL